jgi:hypothetical protein
MIGGPGARLQPIAAIYQPPPPLDELPGFPGTHRSKAKTRFPGGKRRRWKDGEGRIYEWDYLHGTVEVWNPRGDRHLGDFDYISGRQVGPPDGARRPVEP